MTRTYSIAIVMAFATLVAGQAMAADIDTSVTREQVKAELVEAIQSGNVIVGESGARLNQVFPNNYPAQQSASNVSREQVKAELVEAIRSGNVVRGESSVRLNEAFPAKFPAERSVASKSREQVRAELAEAANAGQLYNHIEA